MVELINVSAASVTKCCLCSQSYPEFCRATFDTATQPVREAVVEMERRYGKVGFRSWLDWGWHSIQTPLQTLPAAMNIAAVAAGQQQQTA